MSRLERPRGGKGATFELLRGEGCLWDGIIWQSPEARPIPWTACLHVVCILGGPLPGESDVSPSLVLSRSHTISTGSDTTSRYPLAPDLYNSARK